MKFFVVVAFILLGAAASAQEAGLGGGTSLDTLPPTSITTSSPSILPSAGLLPFVMVAPGRRGAGQKSRPLTETDLLRLLAGGVYNTRVEMLVRERGVAFSPMNRDLELLQHAGADEELRRAVVQAQETRPGRDLLEPPKAKPVIIWRRVNGSLRWHCVAHCSKYRSYHAKP
jgi:hypothetical protein